MVLRFCHPLGTSFVMSDSASQAADHQPSMDAQIAAHNRQHDRPLTTRERSERFVLVCRDAASLEASRRAAGLPEPDPAPWPESTWRFLAEQTHRARAQT